MPPYFQSEKTMINLLNTGPRDGVTLLLAHGAGTGMDSAFMEQVAGDLAELGIGVARFEFPYMQIVRQTGRRRPPDRMPRLVDSFKEVVGALGGPERLVIGGKSMGGRVASLVATELDVMGVVCLGYPFHPPGKPDVLRTEHLPKIRCPALVLQGERDPFGRRDEVAQYALPASLRVSWMADGDHDLKPRVRSGLEHAGQLRVAAMEIRDFIGGL